MSNEVNHPVRNEDEFGVARKMNRDDFETVFNAIRSDSMAILLANKEEIIPTLFLPTLNEQGEIVRMGAMDATALLQTQNKDILASVMKDLTNHPDHDFCVFAHKGWALNFEAMPDESEEETRARLLQSASVMDSDDKQEVLMIMVRSKEQQAIATLSITRSEQGAIQRVDFGELMFNSGDFISVEAQDNMTSHQNAPSTMTLQ